LARLTQNLAVDELRRQARGGFACVSEERLERLESETVLTPEEMLIEGERSDARNEPVGEQCGNHRVGFVEAQIRLGSQLDVGFGFTARHQTIFSGGRRAPFQPLGPYPSIRLHASRVDVPHFGSSEFAPWREVLAHLVVFDRCAEDEIANRGHCS
jgi:hypothetical protein